MFLPRESHGQRSLAGYSPWGHKESDTTEQEHRSTIVLITNIYTALTQPGFALRLYVHLIYLRHTTAKLVFELKHPGSKVVQLQ